VSEINTLVRVVAKEASLDAVIEAMKIAQRLTLQEEGVLAYQFYQDTKALNQFYVQERYRDKQAWKDHGRSEHMADYLRTVDGLLESVHMHKLVAI